MLPPRHLLKDVRGLLPPFYGCCGILYRQYFVLGGGRRPRTSLSRCLGGNIFLRQFFIHSLPVHICRQDLWSGRNGNSMVLNTRYLIILNYSRHIIYLFQLHLQLKFCFQENICMKKQQKGFSNEAIALRSFCFGHSVLFYKFLQLGFHRLFVNN